MELDKDIVGHCDTVHPHLSGTGRSSSVTFQKIILSYLDFISKCNDAKILF